MLVLLALLLPGIAAADEPWEGIWAYDPDWCRNSDMIGSHNSAPIRITATELDGLENSCTITQVRPDPNGAHWWALQLSCFSEGDSYDAATLLMLQDKNTLWRFDGTGEPARFTRCGDLK